MMLNWYHHGNLKTADNVLYGVCFQIRAKIYLIGEKIDTLAKADGCYKMVISEFDLNAMKIEQLLSFEYKRYENLALPHEALAYGEEYIVIFNPHNDDDRLEFLMINLKTRRIETITVRHQIRHKCLFIACIVEDHVYITSQYSNDEEAARLSILAVNLKTWRKELIESPNAPKILFRFHVRIIAHGKDIFYISSENSSVSIFNTVAKLWIQVEDNICLFRNDYFLQMTYGATVYINNDVFIFKFTFNRLSENWTDVYNCNSMTWRREKILLPTKFNNIYCNCFAFNGKIFIIKNSGQVIRRLNRNRIPQIYDTFFPNSDVMDIYGLDLNPSLKRLCIINLIQNNLPRDKYPKFMQNELQRYIQ